MKIDKSRMLGPKNVALTQGLFLEIGYNPEQAVFTLKDWDWNYEGVWYPSLKRLYLEYEDIVEYSFACEYLLGWNHWQRICKNKILRKHIDEWRVELELKLRSQAISQIVAMSVDEQKGFQAAKYVANKEWAKNGVGRPKKDTSEFDAKVEERLNEEFAEDSVRLASLINKD